MVKWLTSCLWSNPKAVQVRPVTPQRFAIEHGRGYILAPAGTTLEEIEHLHAKWQRLNGENTQAGHLKSGRERLHE